ncbi:MAG: hypothetical protein GF344_16030, partial [Chitinivibrionales bacterium]|nr:hypothetical protein [Chitinivibrionales bacterium]MBD3358204.1 hypothetical protein [Chitinivibrionales bacterium]
MANGRPTQALTDRSGMRSAVLFLLPLFLLLAFFVALPVIGTVWTSFFRDITFLGREWVGLQNYVRLLEDPSFQQSLRFTIMFILASVPLELVVGMIVALLLNYPSKLRGLIRA